MEDGLDETLESFFDDNSVEVVLFALMTLSLLLGGADTFDVLELLSIAFPLLSTLRLGVHLPYE